MQIIGITGKSGSGKSTFANLLAKSLKCESVDIDKIGHAVFLNNPEVMRQLYQKFGEKIYDQDGFFDRKKLGDLIFTSRSNMKELSAIMWKSMESEINARISSASELIILDWILLPHTKFWERCSIKVCLTANDEQRKKQVLERDGISEQYFLKRDSASIYYDLNEFNYVISNDYSPSSLASSCEAIVKKIKF